jgi:uncharacterized protein YkwD
MPGPIRRLLLVALLVAATPLADGAVVAAEPQLDPDEERQRVLEVVNQARSTQTECGTEATFEAAAPLELDDRLTTAAEAHSRDMRERGELTHEGHDGSTVAQRVEGEGYDWLRVAENVALGPRTAEEVVAGWLASDEHCANMMDPAMEHLGIGRDGAYWTQVLAAPR